MRGEEFRTFHVLLQFFHVPLELGPSVLEPRDHLRVGQAQTGRDFVPIGRTEVFLVEEPFLQFEDLVVGEGRPRFPLLLGLLPVVEEVEVVLAIWKRKNT